MLQFLVSFVDDWKPGDPLQVDAARVQKLLEVMLPDGATVFVRPVDVVERGHVFMVREAPKGARKRTKKAAPG